MSASDKDKSLANFGNSGKALKTGHNGSSTASRSQALTLSPSPKRPGSSRPAFNGLGQNKRGSLPVGVGMPLTSPKGPGNNIKGADKAETLSPESAGSIKSRRSQSISGPVQSPAAPHNTPAPLNTSPSRETKADPLLGLGQGNQESGINRTLVIEQPGQQQLSQPVKTITPAAANPANANGMSLTPASNGTSHIDEKAREEARKVRAAARKAMLEKLKKIDAKDSEPKPVARSIHEIQKDLLRKEEQLLETHIGLTEFLIDMVDQNEVTMLETQALMKQVVIDVKTQSDEMIQAMTKESKTQSEFMQRQRETAEQNTNALVQRSQGFMNTLSGSLADRRLEERTGNGTGGLMLILLIAITSAVVLIGDYPSAIIVAVAGVGSIAYICGNSMGKWFYKAINQCLEALSRCFRSKCCENRPENNPQHELQPLLDQHHAQQPVQVVQPQQPVAVAVLVESKRDKRDIENAAKQAPIPGTVNGSSEGPEAVVAPVVSTAELKQRENGQQPHHHAKQDSKGSNKSSTDSNGSNQSRQPADVERLKAAQSSLSDRHSPDLSVIKPTVGSGTSGQHTPPMLNSPAARESQTPALQSRVASSVNAVNAGEDPEVRTKKVGDLRVTTL